MADRVVFALDGNRLEFGRSSCLNSFDMASAKADGLPAHAVLRALRAGDRRHNGAEVEFQRIGEDRLGLLRRQ
jgi:hypothetical protein